MAKNTVNLDELDGVEAVDQYDASAAFDQEVDFSEIKGLEMLPKGEYHLRNASVKLELSKTSSEPKFTIRTEVIDGEGEGVSTIHNISWKKGPAQSRSKNLFIGMGLPADFRGSLHDMATALQDLEYFGIYDIEQSDGINKRTGRTYDPRNRLIATSPEPQTAG